MTNNFKSHYPNEKAVMNNNFMTGKETFLKTNNENLNRTFTHGRKSFNCDEYLSSLRAKLGDGATK